MTIHVATTLLPLAIYFVHWIGDALGFGVRMGPVRVNRRGMSIGGGVGVGPIGFGYGKRIARFNGNSGRDNSGRDIALGAMIFALPIVVPLVLSLPFVYLAVQLDKFLMLPIQVNLKPRFARFRVTKTPLLLLALLLGLVGIHQYALGRIRRGLLYTMTFGVFGIYWAKDIYLITNNKLLDVNARPILGDKVSDICKRIWHGAYLGKLQSWRKWIGIVCLPGAVISMFSPSASVSRVDAVFSLAVILLLLLNPKILGINRD